MAFLTNLFAFVFLLAGVAGFAHGVWSAYDQDRRIKMSQPVVATVVSGQVEMKKTKGFIRFKPTIEYEYVVAGLKYQSNTTTPTECLGSKEWADGVVKRFPVGRKMTARVIPTDPADSFLIPKYGSYPYLQVLVCTVVGAWGVSVLVDLRLEKNLVKALQESFGTARLVAKEDRREKERTMLAIGVTGVVLGCAALTHYFYVSTPPTDRLFWAMAFCYSVATFSVLGWALSAFWMRRGFGMETLTVVDQVRPTIGRDLSVHVSQPIHFAGTIRLLVLQLVLEKRFDYAGDSNDPDSVLHLEENILFENLAVNGNEVLDGRATFTLPAFFRPSTPALDNSKEHYMWSLRMRGKANGVRTLTRDYLVQVCPPADT